MARVGLVKRGSSYGGSASVLLTGVRNPLALVLAPGGAVLIGDWGTGTICRIRREH